jgi:hypothetical protein
MVDCSCYLVMLEKKLMLQLLFTEISIHTQWFMLDRAKLHAAHVVLDFLHETSGYILMSHRFPWTHLATSQPMYINHFKFFMQGFLKKKLFMWKSTTLVECKAFIIQLCCTVAEGICQRWSRVCIHLEEVMGSYWWSH